MKNVLRGLVLAIVVIGSSLALQSTASAHGGHGGGHSGHGHGGHGHGGYPSFHNTSHFHYHPGGFQRHGNHFHYVPGHFDLHRTGHWHW